MPFKNKYFTPIGGQAHAGNSPAHWSYESSTDILDDVMGPGYFNDIATQVKAGDFINVSLADGKAIVTISSATNFPKLVVIDSDSIRPGGGSFLVEVFTGTNKNLILDDNLKFHVMNNTLPMTVTIPENASEPFSVGAEMEFLREGTGTVTFLTAGATVLESRDALVTINAQYSAVTLKKTDTNEWVLVGDLA